MNLYIIHVQQSIGQQITYQMRDTKIIYNFNTCQAASILCIPGLKANNLFN